jgi:hypothetical protein
LGYTITITNKGGAILDNTRQTIIELAPHQANLINEFAEVILDGTFEQAVSVFEIIFERKPKDDLEMQIFKALCEQKISEQNNEHLGIKGVFKGGKGDVH